MPRTPFLRLPAVVGSAVLAADAVASAESFQVSGHKCWDMDKMGFEDDGSVQTQKKHSRSLIVFAFALSIHHIISLHVSSRIGKPHYTNAEYWVTKFKSLDVCNTRAVGMTLQ